MKNMLAAVKDAVQNRAMRYYIKAGKRMYVAAMHAYGSPVQYPYWSQGIQSADSIYAISLLTSGLFTVNTMWANRNVLSKM